LITKESLIGLASAVVEDCEKGKAKFVKSASKDLSHTLEWGESAYKVAAYGEVAREVVAALSADSPATVESIGRFLKERMISLAEDTGLSTGFSANTLKRYRLAALAMFVREIERVF
jgi:hypothetical protein